jgi:hypothetical protein
MNMVIVAKKQQGVVLVISLILLLAVTLIVVSASNLTQSNLKIVQNMESRNLARHAASSALEEAISSGRFTVSPDSIFAESCGSANRKCYDFNGDGTDDVSVVVSEPLCVIVIPKKNSELDIFNSEADASCYLPPVFGSNTQSDNSMCASSVWEFEAVATDLVTGAEVTVRQGVSVLTTLNRIDTACPA